MKKNLNSSNSFKSKLGTILLVILMPYVGFFILLFKKPFSKKANKFLSVYCVLMSIYVFSMFSQTFKEDNSKLDIQATDSSLPHQEQNNENEKINEQINSEQTEVKQEENKTEPFFKISIEDEIKKMYEEGLDFSSLNYVQWEPMEIALYHCKNTFKGKLTKKEHSYLARIGYDAETNTSIMYFLSIDGETVYWDEDEETKFIDRDIQ